MQKQIEIRELAVVLIAVLLAAAGGFMAGWNFQERPELKDELRNQISLTELYEGIADSIGDSYDECYGDYQAATLYLEKMWHELEYCTSSLDACMELLELDERGPSYYGEIPGTPKI